MGIINQDPKARGWNVAGERGGMGDAVAVRAWSELVLEESTCLALAAPTYSSRKAHAASVVRPRRQLRRLRRQCGAATYSTWREQPDIGASYESRLATPDEGPGSVG